MQRRDPLRAWAGRLQCWPQHRIGGIEIAPCERERIGGEALHRGPLVGRRRHEATSLGGDRRDRKSVVEGKSVSVRVDLGGRRIIKKKNKKINSDNIHNIKTQKQRRSTKQASK